MGILKAKNITDIAKVTVGNLLKLLSGILVGLLLPKIVGITDYGYYKTFTLYTSYIGLFALGINDGVYLKYGGKDYDDLDCEKMRTVTRFYIVLEVVISFSSALLFLFFTNGEYKFIFLLLALFLSVNNIQGYYQSVSQATSRFSELSQRTIIFSIANALLVVSLWIAYSFFDSQISYRIYIIIFCLIHLILTIWYLFTYRKITFGKAQKLKEAVEEIKGLIIIGIPLLVANLCSSLILTIDRQFVNVLFDTDTYAVYAFAYNMLALITTALAAISTVLYPTLKKTDPNSLEKHYSTLVEAVSIIVFLCLCVYFPLTVFIDWFLPKYHDSLIIFRIILPGLAISSAVSIVMHNYYKAHGKELLFFIKSIIVLALSCAANTVAYVIFKNTISISIASVLVLIVWYVVTEFYFIKRFKVKWVKNILYILVLSGSFYLITFWDVWWASLLVYIFTVFTFTYLFYFKDVNRLFRKVFCKKKAIETEQDNSVTISKKEDMGNNPNNVIDSD